MALSGFVVWLLIAVCLMMGPSVKAEVRPGFKARISQSGLNYLRDVGLDVLKEEIKKLDIPDFSGDAHVSVIGHISYTVSNLRITSFSIPSATITTQSAVGLVVRASGISLSLTGNWHYSNRGFIHIRDSGTFDASMYGASLSLTLRIGKDQSGRPTVSSTSWDCSFDAGSVHAKLHGGASWLYNLFAGDIRNMLKNVLNQQTCSEIRKGVNTDLQKQFSNLKTQAPIDNYAVIDYSLVASPAFEGRVDTAHKGEVFPRDTPHKEAPYTVPVIPSDPDVSRHVFFWITDYLVETAAYVYYQAGKFEFNVTQDKLPPGKFDMNTSSFFVRTTLPDVAKKYPNMLLQVDAKATAPPASSIGAAHFNASLKADLDFFVTLPNKTLVYLFTLNSMKPIREAVNVLLHFFLMPMINAQGNKGFPLPTNRNIKLEKPVLKQGKGFIKLGADINFTPSALLY